MYFYGAIIFFFIAILCVLAWFSMRKKRQRYEREG
jgi:hypothetical protein